MLNYAYTDSVSGAVVLSLRGSAGELGGLTKDVGQPESPERLNYASGLVDYAWSRHRSTFIHEWMHILQSVAYPVLYLRAVRTSRHLSWWGQLARSGKRLEFPLRVDLDYDWYWSERIDTVPVRLTVEDSSISIKAVEQGRARRGLISERDLIEEDATLAEYRVEVGGHGNGRGYRRWLAEAPHYTSVFSFLTRHLSDDHAFRLLAPLVRASFWSIRPIDAFAKLLATILENGSDAYVGDEAEIDGSLDAIFLDILRGSVPEADASSVDPTVPTIRDTPGIITEAQFLDMVARTPHLPLQPLAAHILAAQDPSTLDAISVLRNPAPYFGRRGTAVQPQVIEHLFPPLLVFGIADPSFPLGKTLIQIAPGLLDYHIPPPVDVDYPIAVVEIFRAKLLFDSLVGGRPPLLVCPHRSCGFHGSGLCNGWLPIPKHHQGCTFPSTLRLLSGYVLAADGRSVVPAPGGENDGSSD